jgi:methionyl-tRNA formyltransferase
VPIDDATTAGELHDTLAPLGAEMMAKVLTALASGSVGAQPQPEEGVTYAAKIDKVETHIDLSKPAARVLRQIHGLSPVPGAWFAHGPERIRVLRAALAPGQGVPGTVIGGDLTVACGEGAVRIVSAQRAGKVPMEAEAFLRGYSLPPGSRLE